MIIPSGNSTFSVLENPSEFLDEFRSNIQLEFQDFPAIATFFRTPEGKWKSSITGGFLNGNIIPNMELL